MKTRKWMVFPLLFAAPMLHAQTKAVVVEEVVARVNNDVITQEDLAKARDAVQGEVQEECRGCTPEQIQQQVATKDKNVLRDLIDQSLLVQRAKDTNPDAIFIFVPGGAQPAALGKALASRGITPKTTKILGN